MTGIVYTVSNKITAKQYIGQTIQLPHKRWKQHIYNAKKGQKSPLYDAIRKYGVKNFEIEEIATADNISDLNQMEIWAIKNFWTLVPNGYNLSGGGYNKTVHPDSRARMSNSAKGRKKAPRTPEHKENIRLSRLGKKASTESRKKMSDSHKGQVAWNKGKTGYRTNKGGKSKYSNYIGNNARGEQQFAALVCGHACFRPKTNLCRSCLRNTERG